MRSGVIARKLGMSREFQPDGRHVPVTVLQLEGCRVVACKNLERDGYTAVQLGAGDVRSVKVLKPMRGYFAKAGVTPRRKLAEFRVSPDNQLEVGQEITADHFVAGQYVDARGVSMGKGFAGVIKRHNFSSGRMSHGASVSHRAHGSTGQHQDPGKVFKGKKMAGHMGAAMRTIQNLQIVRTDAERGLILVRGGIPGPKGGWIMLSDACKKRLPEEAPRPAGIRGMEKPAEAGEPQEEQEVKETQEAKGEEEIKETKEAKEAGEVKETGESAPAGESQETPETPEAPEAPETDESPGADESGSEESKS